MNDQETAVEEFSQWLAHPNELGQRPQEVHVKSVHEVELAGYGSLSIFLMSYRMQDGTQGRGFVNPITWAFFNDGVERISDEALLQAYCGWAWLFPAIQDEAVLTDFESSGEEQAFAKAMSDIQDFRIVDRFKIGDSEIFEYRGQVDSDDTLKKVRGAGNTEAELQLTEDMPEYCLPAVYFLVGHMVSA